MPSFNFFDVVMFLGVSQGLFIATSLQFIKKKNWEANKVLVIMILFAVLMLFGRLAVYRLSGDWVARAAALADSTILVFGPLLFLYVNRLALAGKGSYRLSFVHLLPVTIYLILFLWSLAYSISELNALYQTTKLGYVLWLVETAGLVSIIVYWLKSAKVVRKIRAVDEPIEKEKSNYLIYLLASLLLLILFWSVSYLNAYFLRVYLPYINYNSMWVSTPIFIYMVGFYSLRQPDLFRVPLIKKAGSVRDRLKPQEISSLKDRLEHQMVKEKIFLQQELTLQGLAKLIDTTPNNLSWLLNKVYKTSFTDYINQFRIQAFQEKVAEQEHRSKTLLALALDVGFNSKSTFYKAFKALKGDTPSNYIKANP